MPITVLFERRVSASSENEAITVAVQGYVQGGAPLPSATSFTVFLAADGMYEISCYTEDGVPQASWGITVPFGLASVPAPGGKRVSNIFVNGEGKLVVQYET